MIPALHTHLEGAEGWQVVVAVDWYGRRGVVEGVGAAVVLGACAVWHSAVQYQQLLGAYYLQMLCPARCVSHVQSVPYEAMPQPKLPAHSLDT
jgi:hypothetical protein